MDVAGLNRLVGELSARGYRVIGPVLQGGAIALGELRGVDDLPRGCRDVQAPGSYRVERSADPALFAWAVGPHSVKSEVFPPRAVVWRAQPVGEDGTIAFTEDDGTGIPVAVVGARPCELAALAVLDRVLGSAATADPVYRRRRDECFVVAVECGTPSGTCFCASMGSGPGADAGFDLALTELVDEKDHRFVVRVGTDRGAQVLGAVLEDVGHRDAEPADLSARADVLEAATRCMGRALDTRGLPELLADNLEHPRWDEVAGRCLACGNCTLVCPTCFCSTVQDTSDLGGTIERSRSWSSCFDLAHSYIHGGPVRPTTRSMYRQWMTHKLSTWWDQFGTSGCVGCGRCITWCPVGIDITEEAAAIRASAREASRA